MSVAAVMASPTTTAICQVPVPIAETNASAIAMPTATPTAISTARRRRWPTVSPRVITAATGAKNARSCPNTSVATSQAMAAATDV